MFDLLDDEILDDLDIKNKKIIQKQKGFKFGIDAVLLADFVDCSLANKKVVDFGTGTGIIPTLLVLNKGATDVFAIDVQERYVDMATRTVKGNQMQPFIQVEELDIKKACSRLGRATVDVVVSNPPYMKGSLANASEEKHIARHEVLCSIDDIMCQASAILKQKGALYLVHRPSRLVDIFEAALKYDLVAKKMRMVVPKKDSKPTMVLLKFVKYANRELTVEKDLIIYNDDSSYTDEILRIYRKDGDSICRES